MRPSIGWTLASFAICLGCTTAAAAAEPPLATTATTGRAGPSEVVAETLSLQFHSAFWLNLHHVLYAAAWAHRGLNGPSSLAGALPDLAMADLTAGERGAWERAVAYYDRELASRDLLFDEGIDRIRLALLTADGETVPAGLAPEHRAVLAEAAPVYLLHWWPAHDRVNRAWIADALPRVRSLAPIVPDRLAALYRTPWFTTAVRVDVVIVANRQGAYTQLDPAPAHVIISAGDPHNQGWAAAEIVFHEASHALVEPIDQAFGRELAAAGKPIGVLWHVALFYMTGEVVRQALAARGIDYSPYLYATGLFGLAWPELQGPLEIHWRPYVDGKSTLVEAVRNVVAACPPPGSRPH